MALLGKMAVLFFYMLLGYICYKKKYLDEAASKMISFIVLNMASPALTISGAVNRSGELEGGLLPTVIASIVLYAALILLAVVLPPLLRVPAEKRSVYRLMTIFSNIGFMGFPVLQAMFGDDALLQAAIFQIPFNLLIYTYGVYVLTKDQTVAGADGQAALSKSDVWKKMINPGMIASVACVAIYAFSIAVPELVKEISAGLGALTGPLSMIVIGIALARTPLKSLFTDVRLLVFSAIKLLVIPVIGVFIAKQFIHNDPMLIGVIMVMIATPVGSMTAMLAQQYGGDIDSTSKGVALTTLLSVLTIPLVGMLVL